MQDIGLVSGYIDEYGPLIVILAVFLILFISVIGYILRTNKKSIEDNIEMSKQMLTSLLNERSENNSNTVPQKKYDERNIVNIFMSLNKTLKSACDGIIDKSGSDRSAIYVFHNGSHASHGLPFVKITCICESISKYSNSNIQISEHSGVSISLFDSIVTNLYDNSEHRIILNETTEPSDIIFLHNTKIKDCFFYPIYDNDNNMMGFVINGYNTIDESRTFEKEKEYLVDLAEISQPVIEYSNVQNQNEED